MGYRIFRDENTVVLEQGTVVIDLPIVDSYFGLNSGGTSYNIKTVQSMKSASIPRADIGTYSNELGVLYTEESLLAFLRLYCSLTDKIPAPIIPPTVPTLPPGTYVPKNTVSGAFDLLWEGVTGNSDSGDGFIQKVSGFGDDWNGSGFSVIEHNGDFELNFTFNNTSGSNALFGLAYYKPGDYLFDIDFAFKVASGAIWAQESLHAYYFTTYTGQVPSIKREGMEMKYYLDGVEVRSVDLYNDGVILISCSFFDELFVENIEVVIP